MPVWLVDVLALPQSQKTCPSKAAADQEELCEAAHPGATGARETIETIASVDPMSPDVSWPPSVHLWTGAWHGPLAMPQASN